MFFLFGGADSVETIKFVFDGQLADEHRMDFYEAARFQYAAARLSVKLDQFRRTGRFTSKITAGNNTSIELKPFREGSFGLEIVAPALAVIGPMMLEVPLTALWSYVIERVFKPAGDDTIRDVLRNEERLIALTDKTGEQGASIVNATLDILRGELVSGREARQDIIALYERLNAETERRAYLQGLQGRLEAITPEQDAKLVTMAAPLLKEFVVPLRRSASRATVLIDGDQPPKPILSIDKAAAQEIELDVVDPEITPVLIDIIQYNKETGWGKFRSKDFRDLASFAVPADRKDKLQARTLAAMNQGEVYVQAYYVRSQAGIPKRIILVDYLDLEAVEAGTSPQR